MDHRDIETFLELVRTRNITKTAENLYLSQSTVSNRLKNLEDELGCQLIFRAKGHRIIQLTRQGEEFVPVAERWRNLFEETELLKSSSLSTLRIASSESTYYEYIAPFLREFLPRYPHCKMSVQICDSEYTYDMLEKGLIDYGFASYEASRAGILCRCIDTQPLCILRYAEHPQPELTIHPDQLDPDKEIRFIGGYFRNMSAWRQKWFGVRQKSRMEVNTSRGIIPFMIKSDYWAISPLDMAKRLASELSLQIYQLEEQPEPWKIYMLKQRNEPLIDIELRRVFETELDAYLEIARKPS